MRSDRLFCFAGEQCPWVQSLQCWLFLNVSIILILDQPIDKLSAIISSFCVKLPCQATACLRSLSKVNGVTLLNLFYLSILSIERSRISISPSQSWLSKNIKVCTLCVPKKENLPESSKFREIFWCEW